MGNEIIGNVLRNSQQKSTKRLLMVILAGEANSLGVAQTKIDLLAEFANVDTRRISTHISGLEKANELFVFRRDGLHNVYIVLPGLNNEQRRQAIKFINTQFKPVELLTLDNLPPTEPSGDTPDESVRGDGISGDQEPLTEPSGVPLTEPSGPPDGTISGYKDSVVVESESDPDLPGQQQQQPPAPVREPTPIERTLFGELHVSESIWTSWMRCDSVTVVAAFLHVTQEDGVESQVGLMRAMLESGRGTPKRKYFELAQQAIERGSLDVADPDIQESVDDPDGDQAWMDAHGLNADQRAYFLRLRAMGGSVSARRQFEREVASTL